MESVDMPIVTHDPIDDVVLTDDGMPLVSQQETSAESQKLIQDFLPMDQVKEILASFTTDWVRAYVGLTVTILSDPIYLSIYSTLAKFMKKILLPTEMVLKTEN